MPRNGIRAAVAAAIICISSAVLPTPSASAALPAGTSHFVPVTKTRLMDTAVADSTKWVRSSASVYQVKLAGRIPAGTRAVVVQITVLGTSGQGYLTAWPGGTPMPAGFRTLNVTGKGQTRTSLAQVRVTGAGPTLALSLNSFTARIAVDLIGAYTGVTDPAGVADGRFVPLSGSHRALNRAAVPANGSVTADLAAVGVPADAKAALVSLTAETSPAGGWTTYADGQPRPGTRDLSLDAAGQNRQNLSVISLDGDALVRVFASAGGTASLDVVGYYTGSSAAASTDGLYVPATTQLRMVDTRSRPLPFMNAGAASFLPGTGAPASVQALAGVVYTTGAWDAGRLTSRPAGTTLPTIPVGRMFVPRDTYSAAFISQVSNRGASVLSDKGAHLVIDVVGWYIGPRATATVATASNFWLAPKAATTLRWRDTSLHTSRIEASKVNTTYATTLIADKGIVVGFNGMTTLGKTGNTMLFAHRTTHGGIFRYINTIKVGATFSIQGSDGLWYNYRVVHKGVTTPLFNNVMRFAAPYGPVTAQLIACSKPDGTPTSTAYRIVVTGMLVSVTSR